MTELIKVNYDNDTPTVSARELHEFLEVGSKYNDWFNRMVEYGFTENVDFIAIAQKKVTAQGNETEYIDHQLTIEMGKELSMLQRNEKGGIIRKYFIGIEKDWNTPELVMARALKIANARMDKLSSDNSTLKIELEENKPKVIFADAVSASHSSILVGELAKLIKQNGIEIGGTRLFAWLRDNGYLIKRAGSDYNLPTQKSMELGLCEIKETSIVHSDGHTSVNKTPKITGKGQQYFVNKFLNN